MEIFCQKQNGGKMKKKRGKKFKMKPVRNKTRIGPLRQPNENKFQYVDET